MADTTLKHRFHSTKFDSTDTTLVQPSEWNDNHKFTVPDGLSANQGVLLGADNGLGEMTINALATATPLAVLRRNAGNSAYEFGVVPPVVYPDGTLTALGGNLSGKVAAAALQFYRRNQANNDFEFVSFADGFQFATGGLLSGSNATGGLQRLRRNISNTNYEWVDDRVEYSIEPYNFPTIVIGPGHDLAIGANTVTLPTVPIGVNGTDLNHYVWISGGSGTAEKALITGGTAVGGGANQTLIITCANSHTGAWTLSSATAGFQECIQAIAITGGLTAAIFTYNNSLPHPMHATVTWPDNGGSYVLDGKNPLSFSVAKSIEFTTGDLFTHAGHVNLNYIVYKNNGLSTGGGVQTSGSLINMINCIGYVLNNRLSGGYNGITLNGVSGAHISGNFYGGFNNSCITMQASGGVPCFDIIICDEIMFPSATCPFAINIKAVDGCTISNIVGSQAVNAIFMQPPFDGVSYVASMMIDKVFWDGPGASGIVIAPVASTGVGGIRISNCQINGGSNPSNRFSTLALYSIGLRGTGIQLLDVSLENCIASYGLSNGFEFGNSIAANSRFTINNCQSVGNGGDGFKLSFAPNAIVSNCASDENVGYAYSMSNCGSISIIGGQAFSNTAGVINLVSATALIVKDIIGFSNTFPATVTNAATVIFPLHPTVKISGGGTAITTINGPLFTGWRVHIINIGTSTVVGGGGNVPLAHTIAQFGSIDLVYDGTNWM